MRGSLKAYSQVKVSSQAAANPHRVVSLLLGGCVEKLLQANLAIEQGNLAKKGEHIGRVLEIISHLRGSLDHDEGGDIAGNLADLYDYMSRRLAEANLNQDQAIVMEVVSLLKEIKEGWDGIPAEFHELKQPA